MFTILSLVLCGSKAVGVSSVFWSSRLLFSSAGVTPDVFLRTGSYDINVKRKTCSPLFLVTFLSSLVMMVISM